jgi:hypothetical protein
MKNLTLLLLLVTGGLLLPLHAQQAPTMPDIPAQDVVSPPAQTQSAPPRDIMPRSLNHKPNPTNPPAEIAGPIDKFFKTLKTGDYPTAYETFLTGSRLGEQKQKMSTMISHTEEAFGIYGKMNDYEIYDNYSVGSNVLVLTYLTRHDIQPLRWRFIYYRPDKTWQLNNMGLDDFLLDMLD